MTTFNIYFNGTCIDTLENSTARKALNHIKRSYKNPEQCVSVAEGADQAEAVALSKKLHVQDEQFEQEVRDTLSDAELTGAARKRSGETVCFSNKDAGPTHGVVVLTTDRQWVTLIEGVTIEEAREFMRNFNGRPEHVVPKVIKTKSGIVSDFWEGVVKTSSRYGFAKRFVDAAAAQAFIDAHDVSDGEILDFSSDLFDE